MSGIPLAQNFNVKVNQVIDNRCVGLSSDSNAIAFKALGLLRYETDTGTWKYYDGTNFVDLISAGVTYTQGTGVTINPSNEISIGQAVAVSDSPNFTQLSLGNSGTNQAVINLKDNTNIGIETIAQIKGLLDYTNGGQIGFYTKFNGGTLTERMNIDRNGLVSIKTDVGGIAIRSPDGTTEQSNIYNSIFGTKDFCMDASIGSSVSKGLALRIGGVDKLRIAGDGKVGIGTSSPSENLDVNGTAKANVIKINTTATAGANDAIMFSHGRILSQGGGGTNMLLESYTGYLVLKSGDKAVIESADRIFYTTPTSVSSMGHYFTGVVFYFNGSNWASDDRLKWEEEDITNGLEVINKLKPQIYWKGNKLNVEPSEEERVRESGFIAQEVEQIPELQHIVSISQATEDREESYNLNYTQLIAYNVSAIQELHKLVKTLQTRIEILEGQ